MNAWLKQNTLQLFTITIGVFLIIGQWQARQDWTVTDVARNSNRIERLESLAAQESQRLDGVYLRRELNSALLAAITEKLDVMDKRMIRIEARSR